MTEEQEKAWQQPIASSQKGVTFGKHLLVRILLSVTGTAILVTFGFLAYFIRPSGSSIILHYNVYFGVDVLGSWWQAYTLPLLSFLFFLGHSLLAWYFYRRKERIAAYLLLLSGGMLAFGLLIATTSVIFINY